MRALVFDKPGDAAAVLRLGEAPEPVLQPNGVLIEVRARVIQPADLLFVRGVYRVRLLFPQVAGFDGAGVVLELGREVRGLSVGQRVAFRSVGAWAERAAAPAERIYPVPDGIADEIACQFPLNPLTAWGLLDVCSLSSGARARNRGTLRGRGTGAAARDPAGARGAPGPRRRPRRSLFRSRRACNSRPRRCSTAR